MPNDLISKTIVINELIDYQKGSVVSREIIKKEAGTVTIFAFDKGEGLSTHSAPYDAIVQIIEGKAKITIDSKDNFLEAGEMIIMPANISHGLIAIEEFKMILTMLKSKK
ncbi:cupin domain-containing protein [Methanobrevibacter filiformis]|uniref:Cupin domain protein n=1 Tax=Methanobrevibacter filiformis TaxID=55758 RepID=A0A166CFX7_9EURY|nr:cupin domain-containing protein [Methanobrevibacter filiformis]KZX14465.1 cupin domain protein [Methanobrevibacter filiformis]